MLQLTFVISNFIPLEVATPITMTVEMDMGIIDLVLLSTMKLYVMFFVDLVMFLENAFESILFYDF